MTAQRACARRPADAPDLAEVRGQHDAKRALEIAAAGGHNLLMVGPPGCGQDDARPAGARHPAAARLRRGAGHHPGAQRGRAGRGRARPRAAVPLAPPHDLAPGPGRRRRPAAARARSRSRTAASSSSTSSPSSRGPALEALRQPLEEGRVDIVRGQQSVSFPARTVLVAACNPCPCGKSAAACRCGELDRARYQRRLSGPLLDRIDIVCQVTPPAGAAIWSRPDRGRAEGSARGAGAGGRRARDPGRAARRATRPPATGRWTPRPRAATSTSGRGRGGA